VNGLSLSSWFIDAADEAMKLGNPILGNIIMIGALFGIGALPMGRENFKEVISKSMPEDKLDINLTAFDIGTSMIEQYTG